MTGFDQSKRMYQTSEAIRLGALEKFNNDKTLKRLETARDTSPPHFADRFNRLIGNTINRMKGAGFKFSEDNEQGDTEND